MVFKQVTFFLLTNGVFVLFLTACFIVVFIGLIAVLACLKLANHSVGNKINFSAIIAPVFISIFMLLATRILFIYINECFLYLPLVSDWLRLCRNLC